MAVPGTDRSYGDEGGVTVAAQHEVDEFAALLREFKERTDRSYGSLARRLGMNTSTLHRYCAGEAVPVDFAPVERFAALCGASGQERLELHRRWLRAVAARRRPRDTDTPATAPDSTTSAPAPAATQEPTTSAPAPATAQEPTTSDPAHAPTDRRAAAAEEPTEEPVEEPVDEPVEEPTEVLFAEPTEVPVGAPVPDLAGEAVAGGSSAAAVRGPRYRRRRRAGAALAAACALLATAGGLAALPDGGRNSGERRPTAAPPPATAVTAPATPRHATSAPAPSGSASPSAQPTDSHPHATASRHASSPPAARRSAATGAPPLTWSVNSQVWAYGCGHDYVIAKPPAQVPPPPAPQDAGTWAATQSAVHGGETMVELSVQGTSDTAVVLTALRVRVAGRSAPAPGTAYAMDQGCGGVLSPRYFDVDLDKDRPIARAVPGNDGGTPIPAVRMPYRVSATDPEVLLVTARTQGCDCRWYLELDWSSQGRTGTVRVDDRGVPFRTSGIEGLPHYEYDTSARGWRPRTA
ncbi:pyruvate/2-oxoglutarate dehydrogenase complex dihydrolipoamide acyltransferase (E2) component [Streptomyces calvus]|uniref:helix-turn-helix domain-containing protein n=1 Tax=Streptomyces calvus TaxID=67282 RepID=UPI0035142E34